MRTEKSQFRTEKCQFRTEKCQFRTEKCQCSRYLERAAHQSSFALLRTSTVTEPVCPGLLYIWGTPAQFTPGLRCNSGVIRTTEIIMGPVCTVSPYKHSGILYTPGPGRYAFSYAWHTLPVRYATRIVLRHRGRSVTTLG